MAGGEGAAEGLKNLLAAEVVETGGRGLDGLVEEVPAVVIAGHEGVSCLPCCTVSFSRFGCSEAMSSCVLTPRGVVFLSASSRSAMAMYTPFSHPFSGKLLRDTLSCCTGRIAVAASTPGYPGNSSCQAGLVKKPSPTILYEYSSSLSQGHQAPAKITINPL